jgi:dihydrofolate reductase
MANRVFIAASLDGFIAKPDGSIDWLTGIPNPDGGDYGFGVFINGIDALVMGRNTYEAVKDFRPWPYRVPVYVLSTRLPEGEMAGNRIRVINRRPEELVARLNSQGLKNLYIDGGRTIQAFLALDLIDEMTITTVPVLLGNGIPLFGDIHRQLEFRHVNTITYANGFVKSVYGRP